MEEGDKTAKQKFRYSQRGNLLEHEHHLHRDPKVHRERCLERSEPNFMCHALITKEVVQEAEAEELIGKLL